MVRAVTDIADSPALIPAVRIVLGPEAVRRLAAVGSLWAAVDLFHPAVADGTVGWDDAVAEALPGLAEAADDPSFIGAVGRLLACLGDPATGVVEERDVPPGLPLVPIPGSDPAAVRLEWPRPGVAVLSAPQLRPLEGTGHLLPALDRLLAESAEASGLVLDLRGAGMHLAHLLQHRIGRLLTEPVPLPAVQRRCRVTIDVDPLGVQPAGAVTLVDEAVTLPAERAPGQQAPRLACVVDGWSTAGRLVEGLRRCGAAVVLEGSLAPATGHREVLPLAGGAAVALSFGQFVHPCGIADFAPDAALAAGGVATAVEFAAGERRAQESLPRQWCVPRRTSQVPDTDGPLPPWPQRAVGLFRLWSVIQHLYPYLDGIAEEWGGLLESVLPAVVGARTAADYHLAVAGALTRLRDTHGGASSGPLDEILGTAWPDVAVAPIEGHPTVVHAGPSADGLAVGDLLVAVDGQPVAVRSRWLAAHLPASTGHALARRVGDRLLAGQPDTTAVLTVCGTDGAKRTVEVPRLPRLPATVPRRPDIDLVEPGIGCLDLGQLEVGRVGEAMRMARQVDALVVDLRGYPHATAAALAAELADLPVRAARVAMREVRFPAGSLTRSGESQETWTYHDQMVQPARKGHGYRGSLVVVIDAGCISQGEHTALFLAAAARKAVFVGEPTNGANGNVADLLLPGGIRALFTGTGVTHPDGRALQRCGIRPDVPAQRTLAGVRAGRDELFEAALDVARRLATAASRLS